MNNIQWKFVAFAIATAFSMGLIGVAVSYRSITGIILSTILVIIVMGLGFRAKRQEQ
ncbi:MAG: YlaF family protein [Bacillaceae bacterium]|nr:YlaF family protein [Bacillaceae bacterium]